MLTSYSVVCISPIPGRRGRGYVDTLLMFSNEQKPDRIGRDFWDTPEVCADQYRSKPEYTEFPMRNGGVMFVKFNP